MDTICNYNNKNVMIVDDSKSDQCNGRQELMETKSVDDRNQGGATA